MASPSVVGDVGEDDLVDGAVDMLIARTLVSRSAVASYNFRTAVLPGGWRWLRLRWWARWRG